MHSSLLGPAGMPRARAASSTMTGMRATIPRLCSFMLHVAYGLQVHGRWPMLWPMADVVARG
eukprot:5618406-Prymnesium_polylepis.1